jgi:hypothetical protein
MAMAMAMAMVMTIMVMAMMKWTMSPDSNWARTADFYLTAIIS